MRKSRQLLSVKNVVAQSMILVGLGVLLNGCLMGPDYKTREVELPAEWKVGTVEGNPADPAVWWESFNDETLNGLIQTAFEQNTDLQTAGLRVLQARNTRNLTKWLFAPLPMATASANHVNLSKNIEPDVEVTPGEYAVVGQPAIQVVEAPEVVIGDSLDVYSVQTGAAWEPDLWGKVRRKLESDTAALEATQADYDNMAVLTASEVAITYIQIRATQERIAVLETNVARLEKSNGLLDGKDGLGSEMRLNRSLALESRASLAQLRALQQRLENSLVVLLNTTKADIRARIGDGGSIPEPPIAVAAGVPADLLRRRPDVRRVERMAASECARIGAIKAHIMPSFSLSGLIGFSSSDTSDLFQSDSVTGGYGVSTSLFGFLAYPFIMEAARRQDAKFQEAMLDYDRTVREAVREVEDSMVTLLQSRESAKLLIESAGEANLAADETIDGFDGSVADFGTMYQTQQSALRVSDSAINARTSVSIAMINTYTALGGGWETLVGEDMIPEGIRKDMADNLDWWSFGGKHRLNDPR